MAGAAATMAGIAATMAGVAAAMVSDGRGCFGVFLVKDIKGRQANVRNFLLTYIRHDAILPSVWHIEIAITKSTLASSCIDSGENLLQL
jgi:hypothetical protein